RVVGVFFPALPRLKLERRKAMKSSERLFEACLEQCKEEAMSIIHQGFAMSHFGRVCIIFSAAAVVMSAPSMVANTKPTEVPAKVIAHLALQEAPGSEMLLQNKGDKQY